MPARCWATRPVIILDEPTVGLDPKQIIEIRELIRSLGQEHTVLLSSHILSEVNAVCDKVLIMSHGKLVACDTPENLTAHAAGHAALRITVLGTQEAVQAALSPLLEQGAQAVEFVPCEEENAVTARIVCSGGADLRAPAGIALAGAGLAVLRMDAETTSLEDVFLELTGDEPEAGEEETSGRADEDEDGTAAQAALEMAGDAPEEIASEEESTAHAHQPENGEEERK